MTEIYQEISSVIEMFGLEYSWTSALAWIARIYYLIPILQVVYIILVLTGRRFAVGIGIVSASVTFGMTSVYFGLQIAVNSYISQLLGSGLIDYKAAPICLLILSLANDILLIRLAHINGKKKKLNKS